MSPPAASRPSQDKVKKLRTTKSENGELDMISRYGQPLRRASPIIQHKIIFFPDVYFGHMPEWVQVAGREIMCMCQRSQLCVPPRWELGGENCMVSGAGQGGLQGTEQARVHECPGDTHRPCPSRSSRVSSPLLLLELTRPVTNPARFRG